MGTDRLRNEYRRKNTIITIEAMENEKVIT
jgi:hypothetical protein